MLLLNLAKSSSAPHTSLQLTLHVAFRPLRELVATMLILGAPPGADLHDERPLQEMTFAI